MLYYPQVHPEWFFGTITTDMKLWWCSDFQDFQNVANSKDIVISLTCLSDDHGSRFHSLSSIKNILCQKTLRSEMVGSPKRLSNLCRASSIWKLMCCPRHRFFLLILFGWRANLAPYPQISTNIPSKMDNFLFLFLGNIHKIMKLLK